MNWKTTLLITAIVLLATVAAARLILPPMLEEDQNQVVSHSPWPISDRARTLHQNLLIGDLHSDTLLWDRNPLERGTRGHLDLPRLREGNVAIQVFAAVTKSPRGQNYEENAADAFDNITPLTVVQAWPPRTWSSLLQRALYQSERLHKAVENDDNLVLLHTRPDLARFLEGYQPGHVAALLATEGGHPLEADINNLQVLWDAGYRMFGLQHFFDNALGGSLHGTSKSGLTPFGRQAVAAAIKRGFMIDVAHSSPAVVDDVLAGWSVPLVVSHTGMSGVCKSPRNLSDAQMQRIAHQGGLIGIGYWEGAVCDITPAGVASAIAHAVSVLGVDHVALGSDYDGATTVTFTTDELAALTQALLDAGLKNADIDQVMGGNLVRFFLENLPNS